MAEQIVFNPDPARHTELRLPSPDSYVMPGIQWGRFDAIFTPAYWATQVWIEEDQHPVSRNPLGNTLLEETVACVLGGHGMPAEICLAAYKRVLDEEILEQTEAASEERYFELLSAPFHKKDGKPVHYRFARQKSIYLAKIHAAFVDADLPLEDMELRDWLLSLPGIGPKTASWVVRNFTGSDRVAILDIHIHRAGLLAGFFNGTHRIDRHYSEMESRYLEFAQALSVKASILDGVMWTHMRQAPGIVRGQLDYHVHGIREPQSERQIQLGLQLGDEASSYASQSVAGIENAFNLGVPGRSKGYATQ